jgi:hypothetical protein
MPVIARHGLETVRRSAAMAPLSADTVRQLIDGHAELLAEHEKSAARLSRLAPAWIELRNVLNELSVRLA